MSRDIIWWSLDIYPTHRHLHLQPPSNRRSQDENVFLRTAMCWNLERVHEVSRLHPLLTHSISLLHIFLLVIAILNFCSDDASVFRMICTSLCFFNVSNVHWVSLYSFVFCLYKFVPFSFVARRWPLCALGRVLMRVRLIVFPHCQLCVYIFL